MSDGLLTPKQAAAWLNVSLRTLYNLPIRHIKIGALRRYDPADLRMYVDLSASAKPLRIPRAS